MANDKAGNDGKLHQQIKTLLGEIENLTKFMLEKTAQAEIITLRDKLNQEKAHYQTLAAQGLGKARHVAGETVSHVRRCPVEAAITAFSAGWLIWRILRITGGR